MNELVFIKKFSPKKILFVFSQMDRLEHEMIENFMEGATSDKIDRFKKD